MHFFHGGGHVQYWLYCAIVDAWPFADPQRTPGDMIASWCYSHYGNEDGFVDGPAGGLCWGYGSNGTLDHACSIFDVWSLLLRCYKGSFILLLGSPFGVLAGDSGTFSICSHFGSFLVILCPCWTA